MHTTAPKAELKAPSLAAVPMLTLSGVSKSFPGVRALHNVSLSLYPGQVTALIGENGAGKSTLVKILTGIYQPESGEVSVSGEPVASALSKSTVPASSTAEIAKLSNTKGRPVEASGEGPSMTCRCRCGA